MRTKRVVQRKLIVNISCSVTPTVTLSVLPISWQGQVRRRNNTRPGKILLFLLITYVIRDHYNHCTYPWRTEITCEKHEVADTCPETTLLSSLSRVDWLGSSFLWVLNRNLEWSGRTRSVTLTLHSSVEISRFLSRLSLSTYIPVRRQKTVGLHVPFYRSYT